MSSALGTSIKRIVYKEIVAGDYRKLIAQSNDTRSGGGARDLRFSPYNEFLPVFHRMLPHIDSSGIARGNFNWYVNSQLVTKAGSVHPPTTARPNECRIGNIDKCLPNAPHTTDEETLFLLLIQDSNDQVWVSYATDHALLADWHQDVANTIIRAHRSKTNRRISTAGFIDFENGEEYCNHDK